MLRALVLKFFFDSWCGFDDTLRGVAWVDAYSSLLRIKVMEVTLSLKEFGDESGRAVKEKQLVRSAAQGDNRPKSV